MTSYLFPTASIPLDLFLSSTTPIMSHPRPSPSSSPIKKIAKFFADGFDRIKKKFDESSSVASSSVDSYDEAQADAEAVITRQINGDQRARVKIPPGYVDTVSGCIFPGSIRQVVTEAFFSILN